MMDLPQVAEQKLGSLWSRPGGKFAVFIGLVGLGFLGFYLAPIITAIAWNMLSAGIACGCLAAFLFLVTNKRIRMTVMYFYEILMRSIWGLAFQTDPFILAEDEIKDMEKTREKVNDQFEIIDGQRQATDDSIAEKKKEIAYLADKAKAAQKNPSLAPEMNDALYKMKNAETFITSLTPIRDNLEKTGTFLQKVYKDSYYEIEQAKSDLYTKRSLYNAVTKGEKALSTALRLFQGDPEKKLMKDQAALFLKQDIANKTARMRNSLRITSDYMKSIDLEHATQEEGGLRMLDTYDLHNANRVALPTDASDAAKKHPVPARQVGTVDTEYYDKLLEN
jgi:uncharacterized protein (DUF3084 family)